MLFRPHAQNIKSCLLSSKGVEKGVKYIGITRHQSNDSKVEDISKWNIHLTKRASQRKLVQIFE